MRARESIMEELMYRMSTVTGVSMVARNAKTPPNIDDLSAILVFEFPDTVTSCTSRGGRPTYTREMQVVIEFYMSATSEGASSSELSDLADEVKKKLYSDGVTLGGKAASVRETEASRILRPPIGQTTIGMGIVLMITYFEDINLIFS